MPLEKPFHREPSQDVLDFLKEIMKLRFPQLKHQHPEKITIRIQNELVFVDLWSNTGQWIMTEENSLGKVLELENLIKDPQYRAQMLNLFAKGVPS
jgi:hypothetical protein